MKYKKLGTTGLDVSLIGLGTMTWGEQNTQDEAFEQLDYAFEQGINFVDTAEMYPVPPKAETQGATESIIGNWMQARNNREQVTLASKVIGRTEMPWLRDGRPTLSRENIHAAIDTSLQRLQTDYLDLYYLHWPDRKTNFFGELEYPWNDEDSVALEESLQAMADLVKSGKIRHFAVSNETPWGVSECLRISREKQLPNIQAIQNPYNLLNRSFEVGLSEFSQRESIGLVAYSPLAFGVLSGKYANGAKPSNTRLALFQRFVRYNSALSHEATTNYLNIAQKHGLDPAQMALAWVNAQPFVTSNLIGATNMTQLRSNIASIDIDLTEEMVADLEAAHRKHPNPCP